MPRSLLLFAPLVILSGCNVATTGPSAGSQQKSDSPAATASGFPTPALAARAQGGGALQTETLDRINHAAAPAPAAPAAPAATAATAAPPTATANATDTPPDPAIIRAEVLLARARFSPGVVDGEFGTNFKHAIAAYQTAHDLPVTGAIDSATWQALMATPGAAAAHDYVITPADIAGPFAPDVGEDFVKLAAQPGGPQFANPVEALAERFHMSQALLRALNPGVNFAAAGAHIIVVDDAPVVFAKGDVARIDVTKSDASTRAYDGGGKLIAFYPATVGSTERPSPSGTHKVVGVAWNTDYTYDPKKLAWGPRAAGKLVIKPGPNNPVGVVWIDLNAPSYGIHGTPDPDKIGKTASHGCVRLTNWDALDLAHGVKPGVVVRFLGKRGSPAQR